jgi:hypothetical protein
MATSEFRTVFAGVRPSRLAVLLDQNDDDWHNTCRRVIECLSATWGGKYSVLIPTDGVNIAPVFWEVLQAFDPDYICQYERSLVDLKIARPPQYEALLDAYVSQGLANDNQTSPELLRPILDSSLSQAPGSSVGLTPELAAEIKAQLAPFFLEGHVVQYTFSARSEPDHPLTKLSLILPHCDHLNRLFVIEAPIDGIPPLWVESVTGAVFVEQVERLRACGIEAVPVILDDSRAHEVFDMVMMANTASLGRRPGRRPSGSPDGPTAYLAGCPFKFSMAAPGRVLAATGMDCQL